MESSIQTLALPLTNQRSRQIFRYDNGYEKIRMMYDSGARMPVWCTGHDFLCKAYPNAVKTNLSSNISGFGTGSEKGNVYVIPEFELSDGKASYIINNLSIISISKPNIGCDLLISETMFSKADTTTLRRERRELQIVYNNREFYCTAVRRDGSLIDVAVWTQEK